MLKGGGSIPPSYAPITRGSSPASCDVLSLRDRTSLVSPFEEDRRICQMGISGNELPRERRLSEVRSGSLLRGWVHKDETKGRASARRLAHLLRQAIGHRSPHFGDHPPLVDQQAEGVAYRARLLPRELLELGVGGGSVP